MEIVELFRKYDELKQSDFLKMDTKEWRTFIEVMERIVLIPRPDWLSLETFLTGKGLYVWLDLSYLRYAVEEWRGWRLLEVAVSFVKSIDMDVVAGVQPPTFGMAGPGYVYPEEKEMELLEIIGWEHDFERLALRLMKAYGPCILVYAEDESDNALLCTIPKVVR